MLDFAKCHDMNSDGVFLFEFREDFKFFTEMDEIFRRRLKADSSVPDTPAPDEPEDYTLVPDQNKGKTGSERRCACFMVHIFI